MYRLKNKCLFVFRIIDFFHHQASNNFFIHTNPMLNLYSKNLQITHEKLFRKILADYGRKKNIYINTKNQRHIFKT